MSYEKQNFVNDQILTADHLNHIENGIEQLDLNKQDKLAYYNPKKGVEIKFTKDDFYLPRFYYDESTLITMVNQNIDIVYNGNYTVTVELNDGSTLEFNGKGGAMGIPKYDNMNERTIVSYLQAEMAENDSYGVQIFDGTETTIEKGSCAKEGISTISVVCPNIAEFKSITIVSNDEMFMVDSTFLFTYGFVSDNDRQYWDNKVNKNDVYYDARVINNLELIWDGQINDREVTEEYTINNIQYTFVKIADFEIADATVCNADMKIDLNIFGNHSDSISNKSGAFINNACVIKGDKYNLVIIKQDNTDVAMDGVTVNFSKGIWFTKCYDSSHPYAKESFTRVSNLEIISGYVKLIDPIFTENKPGLVIYDENGIALGEIFNSETNNATGECSHAEGYACNAVGKYSHAEGIASRAEGDGSHAECRSTVMESATYGHAEGYGSKAVGEISHAEGYTTEANGKYSHSEGHNSISSGTSSHAEGENCTSNGMASHAEGYFTIASGDHQHVQGRFNVEDTESKYAHIIGNGTSDSVRSDAHTLDWNGNAWFAGNVSINGTPVNDNDLATKQYVDNAVVIEFNAGKRIEKDFVGNINSNLNKQFVSAYGAINLVVGDDYIIDISIDVTDDEGNVTTLNDNRIVLAEAYNAEGSVLLNILDGKIMIVDNALINLNSNVNQYYKNSCSIVFNELIQTYGNNIVVKKLDIIEVDYRQINSELFSSGDFHLLTNAEKQIIGNVLTKDNTKGYTPTKNYHPATKIYVDNSILDARPLYDVSNVVESKDYADMLPITLGEGINYINIPNHINIAQGVEYTLDYLKGSKPTSSGGIMFRSSAIATYDENKDCLVLDFGDNAMIFVDVYYNEEDGTFSKNENNHVYSDSPVLDEYKYLTELTLTAPDATPICDELLKVYKLVTEEEKETWNNKANKEDMYYDTRELQEINITFDGDATGKEVVGFYFSGSGSLSANGLVKITDEIYDNIQSVETVTVISSTSVTSYYCEKDEIVVTDDYILAGTGYRYVVIVKNNGTYELNSGIKPVTLTRGTYIYYSNAYSLMYMNDVKLIINNNNGELSVIDEKYLINSPGRYQEGKVKTITTEEGIKKVVCGENSEIFNSEFNIASGTHSHAEGYNTKAIGASSHAEGSGTDAIGDYSHSEGIATTAKGSGSHAEGSATQAIGDQSHAEGYRTIASADYQHVQGQCNLEDTENKYAHIVGNGSYSARSNAHTLDWDGNAWFAGNVTAEGEPINANDLVSKGYVDNRLSTDVVQVDIIDGILQLTADKYQKTNMLDGTTIAFPAVSKFTEIHLYFDPTENLVINLPDCRKKQLPEIVANKSYELVAIYNMNYWLVEMNVFE